jgi:hypothetical protein
MCYKCVTIEHIRCNLWINIMFPPLQWDELHLKAWSRLKSGLLQGHVQFKVECDLEWYENKVETIFKIHLLNFLGENNFEKVQKPSRKDHLSINGACVGIQAWKNQKKTWGFGLVRNLLGKTGSMHLIEVWCNKNWNGVKGHGCREKWCQGTSCSKVFPCMSKNWIVKKTFIKWKIMLGKKYLA